MVQDMVFNESSNEVVRVIIAFLHSQREMPGSIGERSLEVVRQQLLLRQKSIRSPLQKG